MPADRSLNTCQAPLYECTYDITSRNFFMAPEISMVHCNRAILTACKCTPTFCGQSILTKSIVIAHGPCRHEQDSHCSRLRADDLSISFIAPLRVREWLGNTHYTHDDTGAVDSRACRPLIVIKGETTGIHLYYRLVRQGPFS